MYYQTHLVVASFISSPSPFSLFSSAEKTERTEEWPYGSQRKDGGCRLDWQANQMLPCSWQRSVQPLCKYGSLLTPLPSSPRSSPVLSLNSPRFHIGSLARSHTCIHAYTHTCGASCLPQHEYRRFIMRKMMYPPHASPLPYHRHRHRHHPNTID